MPTQARIGRRLAGYRIEELIGRGGMGVVYRAEHMHLRRTVALKLLAPELAENEDFRERFAHESRIAASIPHPNIVTVYDAGEVDGVLYIAMQFIAGSDLATLLRERRTLDPGQALWILRQAASGLDAAHAHGLVHRDVKPGNVLLDAAGAYLSDFGLTKPTTARTPYTVPGQLVGTINYVAPEQIRGDELSGRTDVYALGCVMYECLGGEVPYPRESEIAALYAHLQDPPPALTLRRPDLPAAVNEPITRALAKDPSERQASCCEFIDSVEEALGDVVIPLSEAPTLPGTPLPRHGAVRRSLTSAVTHLPTAHVWQTHRPSRRTVALAGMALLAAAGGAMALALAGSGGAHKPAAGPTPKPPHPSPKLKPPQYPVIVRAVRAGSRPSAVTVGIGGVWVVNSRDGTVSHIDPVSGIVLGTPISVGAGPVGVTEHAHTLYVASAGDSSLYEVDALTSAPLGGAIPLGHPPRAIATGIKDNAIWIAASDGTIVRVERRSGAVSSIRIGGSLRGIATAQGEAWVTRANGTVVRLRTKPLRIKQAPIRVGRLPHGIAVGDGVVWVANEGSGTVTRLDVHTGRSLGPPIRVGGRPTAITVGENFVWVTNSRDGTVTRLIPPGGRKAGRPVRVGRWPVAVRAGAGSAWVANKHSDSVSRITPLGARPIPNRLSGRH